MSKLGKLITIAGVAGAAGAGVYYYLNKRDAATEVGDEATTTFSETANDVATFFNEKKEAIVNSREYVQLNKSAHDAKEALTKAVKEAAEVFTERTKAEADKVGVVAEEEKENAEDYAFEEFDEAEQDEIAKEIDEVFEDTEE